MTHDEWQKARVEAVLEALSPLQKTIWNTGMAQVARDAMDAVPMPGEDAVKALATDALRNAYFNWARYRDVDENNRGESFAVCAEAVVSALRPCIAALDIFRDLDAAPLLNEEELLDLIERNIRNAVQGMEPGRVNGTHQAARMVIVALRSLIAAMIEKGR